MLRRSPKTTGSLSDEISGGVMATMIAPRGGLEKLRSWRSKKYQDYVRDQPCLKCDQPSIPGERNTFHHVRLPGLAGGQSCKPSDLQGVSLCPVCHERYQNNLTALLLDLDWDIATLAIHMLRQLNDFLAGEKK
jgi:hypothetical protein